MRTAARMLRCGVARMLLLTMFDRARAYPSAPGNCGTPNHGGSAQLSGAAATGSISITDSGGAPVSSGAAGEVLTVTLTDSQNYKGFLIKAAGAATGSLEAGGDGGALSSCGSATKSGCAAGTVAVGHSSTHCGSSPCVYTGPVSFRLTLPASGSVIVSGVVVHGGYKEWNSLVRAPVCSARHCHHLRHTRLTNWRTGRRRACLLR